MSADVDRLAAVTRKLEPGHADFPVQLRQLRRPPALFVRGQLPKGRAIAMVGARSAGISKIAQAERHAQDLADAGYAVVSGGALGIDSAAHRGAIAAADGRTVAILGCGTDRVYPPQNALLFEKILEKGALISPFVASAPPRGWHFLVRNRLIAAMSIATWVFEAGVRSGALNTAQHAARLGRRVFARPGSPGTDRLVHSGRAVAAHNATDVLSLLAGASERRPEVALDPVADAVLSAVRDGHDRLDALRNALSLDAGQVAAALIRLELRGLLRPEFGGRVSPL